MGKSKNLHIYIMNFLPQKETQKRKIPFNSESRKFGCSSKYNIILFFGGIRASISFMVGRKVISMHFSLTIFGSKVSIPAINFKSTNTFPVACTNFHPVMGVFGDINYIEVTCTLYSYRIFTKIYLNLLNSISQNWSLFSSVLSSLKRHPLREFCW